MPSAAGMICTHQFRDHGFDHTQHQRPNADAEGHNLGRLLAEDQQHNAAHSQQHRHTQKKAALFFADERAHDAGRAARRHQKAEQRRDVHQRLLL